MESIILTFRLELHMEDTFADIISANEKYSSSFAGEGVRGIAGKELLVLTCMDSRIIPHQIMGLELGDVKVVRNAGGQLNSEVEKDIILASHILNVKRIIIMPHTHCAMTASKLEYIQQIISEQCKNDASEFTPRLIDDAHSKLQLDVQTLRANPLLRPGVIVQGAFYDVDSGRILFSN